MQYLDLVQMKTENMIIEISKISKKAIITFPHNYTTLHFIFDKNDPVIITKKASLTYHRFEFNIDIFINVYI